MALSLIAGTLLGAHGAAAQRLADLPHDGWVRVVTTAQPPRIVEGAVVYADPQLLRIRRARDTVDLAFPIEELQLVSLMNSPNGRDRRGALRGALVGFAIGTIIAYGMSRSAIEGQESEAFAFAAVTTVPATTFIGLAAGVWLSDPKRITWSTYHRKRGTPRGLEP